MVRLNASFRTDPDMPSMAAPEVALQGFYLNFCVPFNNCSQTCKTSFQFGGTLTAQK